MKLKSIILPVLAVGCLAISTIGSANAYFTTYVTAKGGTHITFHHKEEIHERYEDWKKYVKISCDTETTIPMVVRAQAFSGKDVPIKYTATKWHQEGDWYYYTDYLLGGTSGKSETDELIVAIDPQLVELKNEDADNFNVVVVYEAIPAQFDDDGNLVDPWTYGDKWDGKLRKEVNQ